jgi:ADP-ribosylglycohydrolase
MSTRAERIRAAVIAYAAGDAFGVAYEFEPRVNSVPNELLGKADWPAGGVSDDTLLSLMTIETMNQPNADAAAADFLKRLREAAPTLRGLGPTTRAALGLPVQPEYANQVGNTNGGMMRTALIGLAFANKEERHAWVEASCRATHREHPAVDAALRMADLCAAVLADPKVLDSVKPSDDFKVGNSGVGLDPFETLNAVLVSAGGASGTWQAFERACLLGGDTDTVCALAGALVALAHPESLAELPWLAQVAWHEIPELDACINLLVEQYIGYGE